MRRFDKTKNMLNANLLVESTCTQMTLNGDPMMKINWHTNPEIEITNQSLTFSPEQLDLTVDSIEINLEIKNLCFYIIFIQGIVIYVY